MWEGQNAPESATKKLALSNCCSCSLVFCTSYVDVFDVSDDAAKHLAPACLVQQDCWQAEYSADSKKQFTSFGRKGPEACIPYVLES